MRTKMILRSIALAVVFIPALFATGLLVHAQEITGKLQLRVVDSLGIAIPDANVAITGPSIQGVRGGVSDASGYVHVLALPPGRVSVRTSHTAHQPVVFENVLIQLGKTTSLGAVRLGGRTHELPELIVSSGRSPLLDPSSTRSGGNIPAADFEQLPVERSYRSIVSLLPQANTSYYGDEVNVAGATGLENRYYVDGVDVTDSFLSWTGTNLPYNFVSEIELKEGGYEAEYGGALGGVVNVITPSGSNELHGSASGFFTSNRLTANRRIGLYDPTQGGFSNYDVGVGLGGPLVRDGLWFYAAYNPKMEQQDVPVPSFGISVAKRLIHSFAAKLTWKASPAIQVMLMTTGDPTELRAVADGRVASALANPDPWFSDQRQGGVNMSLRGTYAAENGFLLDVSAARSTRTMSWLGATERGRNEILFKDELTGTWSGGFGFFVDRFIWCNTYRADAMLTAGTHLLKVGLQYRESFVDENDGGKTITLKPDSTYLMHEDWARMTVGNRMPTLYLQDTWCMTDALHLNVGLRWDSQFLVGPRGEVAQKFMNEIQPRAGLTFMPNESEKFFASYGRFYQDLTSVLSESYADPNFRYVVEISYGHDPRINPSGGKINFDANRRLEDRGLKGQCFDEITVGYERLFGGSLKMAVHGIFRTLREAVASVYLLPEALTIFGNPGSGSLSQFPKASREYTAVVLAFQGHVGSAFTFLTSYVLSRNYGNYPGLTDPYFHTADPNGYFLLGFSANPGLYTGLLPNDRTHVFKCALSYRFEFGLTAGTLFTWQSGTPLSELASSYGMLLAPRGTSGRTPSIWDLNVRLAYDLPAPGSRLLLDVFQLASRQLPVDIDQMRYDDFSLQYLNPTYGLAIRYQPAMSVRLGMELEF